MVCIYCILSPRSLTLRVYVIYTVTFSCIYPAACLIAQGTEVSPVASGSLMHEKQDWGSVVWRGILSVGGGGVTTIKPSTAGDLG